MESTPAAYIESFQRATTDAHALTDGLSPEQFNWKPSEKEWSMAECLLHVNAVGAEYLAAMEKTIAAGGPEGAGPFRYGFLARRFIGTVSPKNTMKLKTFGAMNPSSSSDHEAEQVLTAFTRIHEGFAAAAGTAEEKRLDLAQLRMSSPFLKVMRFSVGAFMEAMAEHAHRHLGQARRVTERPGFPAASVDA